MYQGDAVDISWPPRGWKSLEFVKKLENQVIIKDPMSGKIRGLTYRIEPTPIYLQNYIRSYAYHITIDGWHYSVQNKSDEYNVLSFNFQEIINTALSKESLISDIKIRSRPVYLEDDVIHRFYKVALFMIKKIQENQFLDWDQILGLYHIRPTQHVFKIFNCRVEDRLKCHLDDDCCAYMDKDIGCA